MTRNRQCLFSGLKKQIVKLKKKKKNSIGKLNYKKIDLVSWDK